MPQFAEGWYDYCGLLRHDDRTSGYLITRRSWLNVPVFLLWVYRTTMLTRRPGT